MDTLVRHTGGCHCGTVRFEVDAPAEAEIHACNCSICRRVGFLHLIVPRSRFRVTSGAEGLADYRFNTGVARHLFCRRCGVKSFYVPRSNPDGFSINIRCLDPGTLERAELVAFDGQNWEQSAGELRHLSRETD